MLMVALAACAQPPAAAPTTGGLPATSANTTPAAPTRVTIGVLSDDKSLATKLGGLPITSGGDLRFLQNAPLVVLDPQGRPQPRLAAELPDRDRNTWTVNPDGTMTTTWKIRPTALWQDGQPVVARDFVFALQVYLDPAIAVGDREPERRMDRIEPVDDRTFTIYWKQPYPWANQLGQGQLEPLPEHVLGALYSAGDKEAFQNAAFFTGPDYVGAGPYRLVNWIKGSQMDYRAFDGYVLGRPKIDEVTLRINPDPNAAVATVLAGAVDLTNGFVLGQQQVSTLKEQWESRGDGVVISNPTHTRYVNVQQDPGKGGQPALRDVRVRRALISALDRVTIAEVVTAGRAPAADVMVSPNDPLFSRVLQTVPKYPFDSTRALALLRDAGWTRSPAGALLDASGQPFQLDVRTNASAADNVAQRELMASNLSALGMDITQSESRLATEREFNANFTGIYAILQPINVPNGVTVFMSDQCPRADNRYVGGNYGCWANPVFDRLISTATTSLNDAERVDATVQAFQTMNDEVGIITMSYSTENIPIRKGLVGPGPRWPAQGGTTWNIHEWAWTQ
jgi:peptide/nickel transport system substrate-binding protein